MSSSDSQTKRPTGLFDLPRELRDQIYEYALVDDDFEICPVFRYDYEDPMPCVGSLEKNVRCRLNVRSIIRPSVRFLETCKQIYEEAGYTFYSKNVFSFKGDESCEEPMTFEMVPCDGPGTILAALSFFSSRTTAAMAWIKKVKFEFSADIRWANKVFGSKLDTLDWTTQFATVVRDQLPALQHMSLILSSWPVDATGALNDIADAPIDPRISRAYMFPLGALLNLGCYKRVSMEIRAHATRHTDSDRFSDPSSLIACAALFRSQLLQGGDKLGETNIAVHSRHVASEAYEFFAYDEFSRPRDPAAFLYMRGHDRFLVVRSDDDANGRSHLQPPQRLSPLWTSTAFAEEILGCKAGEATLVHGHPYGWGYFRGSADYEGDYAHSDDGDKDSLNGLDLDEDREPVPTEVLRGALDRLEEMSEEEAALAATIPWVSPCDL